ncbi:MAG: lytic transglycosylase domain-containing protein [Nitrospiria bacterium]
MNRLFNILIFLIGICFASVESHAFCFQDAGQIYNVPPQLLWTIAKVESDFNPRSINFRTETDYDFGLMQIHTSWAKKLGKETWRSLGNPCQNVKVGAWILSRCLQKHGYNWKGIGCYNAVSDAKRIRYARKVFAVLKKINNIQDKR